MNKRCLSITVFLLILISCTSKKPVIGNWMRAEDGIVLHFINDSTGSIERADTNTHRKIEQFKYRIQNDTFFELSYNHIFPLRNWTITKLDKDSFVIYCEGTTARYYRVP